MKKSIVATVAVGALAVISLGTTYAVSHAYESHITTAIKPSDDIFEAKVNIQRRVLSSSIFGLKEQFVFGIDATEFDGADRLIVMTNDVRFRPWGASGTFSTDTSDGFVGKQLSQHMMKLINEMGEWNYMPFFGGKATYHVDEISFSNLLIDASIKPLNFTVDINPQGGRHSELTIDRIKGAAAFKSVQFELSGLRTTSEIYESSGTISAQSDAFYTKSISFQSEDFGILLGDTNLTTQMSRQDGLVNTGLDFKQDKVVVQSGGQSITIDQITLATGLNKISEKAIALLQEVMDKPEFARKTVSQDALKEFFRQGAEVSKFDLAMVNGGERSTMSGHLDLMGYSNPRPWTPDDIRTSLNGNFEITLSKYLERLHPQYQSMIENGVQIGRLVRNSEHNVVAKGIVKAGSVEINGYPL